MQDGCRIFGSGKYGKMAKKYQQHKLPSCLGYPKHEGKDEENLTHFFGHYRGVRVEVRAVRHLGCRKWKLLLLPRVRPSGITRGDAWCVPAGDIIIAFENTIRLSVHILIASASALIVSASALIAWELTPKKR